MDQLPGAALIPPARRKVDLLPETVAPIANKVEQGLAVKFTASASRRFLRLTLAAIVKARVAPEAIVADATRKAAYAQRKKLRQQQRSGRSFKRELKRLKAKLARRQPGSNNDKLMAKIDRLEVQRAAAAATRAAATYSDPLPMPPQDDEDDDDDEDEDLLGVIEDEDKMDATTASASSSSSSAQAQQDEVCLWAFLALGCV